MKLVQDRGENVYCGGSRRTTLYLIRDYRGVNIVYKAVMDNQVMFEGVEYHE